MGLISGQSQSAPFRPDKTGEPQTEPEGDLDLQPAPMLDQRMPVEVMKDFDTILLFGRLTTDGPSALTVWRIPGEEDFPVCPPGSAMLVRGYDVRMDPVLLLGRVAGSTGAKCVVGDSKWIPYETRRQGARYPLTPLTGVCALDIQAIRERTEKKLLVYEKTGQPGGNVRLAVI